MISQANRGVQCVASNVRCGERGLRGQSLPIRSRFAFLIVANVFRRSTKLTSILTFGFSLMSVSVASMALSFGWQNGAAALAASSRRPRRAASFLSRQVPPPVARMKRGLDSGPRLPRWAGPVPRTDRDRDRDTRAWSPQPMGRHSRDRVGRPQTPHRSDGTFFRALRVGDTHLSLDATSLKSSEKKG